MLRSFILLLILLSFCGVAEATDYTGDGNNQLSFLMEDSGNETDASANTNTGVETGGTIPQSSDRKFGSFSRDFEAADTEYLQVTDDATLDIGGPLSVVAWVKLETIDVDNTIDNKGDEDAGGNPFAWRTSVTAANVIAYHARGTGGVGMDASGSTELDVSTWYHTAFVHDFDPSSQIRVYLDGVQDGFFNPATQVIRNGNDLYVGVKRSGGSFSNYFDGLIDEYALFDRDLNSTEINDIMDNGLEGAAAAPTFTPKIIFF